MIYRILIVLSFFFLANVNQVKADLLPSAVDVATSNFDEAARAFDSANDALGFIGNNIAELESYINSGLPDGVPTYTDEVVDYADELKKFFKQWRIAFDKAEKLELAKKAAQAKLDKAAKAAQAAVKVGQVVGAGAKIGVWGGVKIAGGFIVKKILAPVGVVLDLGTIGYDIYLTGSLITTLGENVEDLTALEAKQSTVMAGHRQSVREDREAEDEAARAKIETDAATKLADANEAARADDAARAAADAAVAAAVGTHGDSLGGFMGIIFGDSTTPPSIDADSPNDLKGTGNQNPVEANIPVGKGPKVAIRFFQKGVLSENFNETFLVDDGGSTGDPIETTTTTTATVDFRTDELVTIGTLKSGSLFIEFEIKKPDPEEFGRDSTGALKKILSVEPVGKFRILLNDPNNPSSDGIPVRRELRF